MQIMTADTSKWEVSNIIILTHLLYRDWEHKNVIWAGMPRENRGHTDTSVWSKNLQTAGFLNRGQTTVLSFLILVLREDI